MVKCHFYPLKNGSGIAPSNCTTILVAINGTETQHNALKSSQRALCDALQLLQYQNGALLITIPCI